jgi:hypothetical protein
LEGSSRNKSVMGVMEQKTGVTAVFNGAGLEILGVIETFVGRPMLQLVLGDSLNHMVNISNFSRSSPTDLKLFLPINWQVLFIRSFTGRERSECSSIDSDLA